MKRPDRDAQVIEIKRVTRRAEAPCGAAYHLVDISIPSGRQQSSTGGPSRAASGEVRDQILAHATRLFAARGFDATAIQEIAEAVGIRKPSLLYHFASKDELRRAVLETILSRWNDVLPRVLRAATSGEDQFIGVMSELISFFSADRDRARLLVREVLDRPDDVRSMLATHVSPWIEVVAGHIRRGQDKGSIHPDVDPEAYVIHIINLVLTSLATYDRLSPLASLERHRAELLRIARASLFLP